MARPEIRGPQHTPPPPWADPKSVQGGFLLVLHIPQQPYKLAKGPHIELVIPDPVLATEDLPHERANLSLELPLGVVMFVQWILVSFVAPGFGR